MAAFPEVGGMSSLVLKMDLDGITQHLLYLEWIHRPVLKLVSDLVETFDLRYQVLGKKGKARDT